MECPKISVIVPIYNAEKYLRRCVDSILAQTFTDFELLLVDDGSSDKSGEICDEYAQKDSRVRAFHKKNGGVSSARNLGMYYVHAEWITFVDSDDILFTDALSKYMQELSEGVDFVMAGYEKYDESNRLSYSVSKYCRNELTPSKAIAQMFRPKYYVYQGYIWNKIFRKNIIDSFRIKFNESIYFNEDRLFIVEYLCNCSSKCIYITYPVYKYYIQKNSAMYSLNNCFNKKYVTDFYACEIMVDLINKKSTIKNLLLAKYELYTSYYTIYHLMNSFNDIDKNLLSELKKRVSERTNLFIMIIIKINRWFKSIRSNSN